MIIYFSSRETLEALIQTRLKGYYNNATKGTVMQIEKASINDRLCVSKVS